MKPQIADYSDILPVTCPCGITRRAFVDPPNGICSLHRVEIKVNSETHYHKKLTEIYYFLDGEGRMELDGELTEVRPGMSIFIPPGVKHRAVVKEGQKLVILNFVTPPFDPGDEYFD